MKVSENKPEPAQPNDAFAFDDSTFDKVPEAMKGEFDGFDTTGFEDQSPVESHRNPDIVGEEEKKEEPATFEYQCMVLSKNVLTSECKVEINDPQIQDEGWLSSNYLDFNVKTTGNDVSFNVRRKDRDFNVLREYLLKQFPHVLIPSIPS